MRLESRLVPQDAAVSYHHLEVVKATAWWY